MDVTLARMVQLIARLIAVVLTVKGFADSDHAQVIGQAGGELAGAVLAWGLDLAIHSGRFGWLAKQMGEEEKGRQGEEETTGNSRNSAGVLLAICLLAFGFAAGGCATSETNRAAQAIVATQEQAVLARQLHDAGVTTPAQETRILQFLQASAKAEDAYYAAIRAGDSEAMKASKAALAAAAEATRAELAKYQLPPRSVPVPIIPTTTPTTQPN